MAQRVYWNWKDADLTADLNKWVRGFLPSGVYRGFDKNIDATSGWNFRLSPLSTSVAIVDAELDTINTSVLVTPQGSIITEDDHIILPITPAHPTLPRIDLIICSHQYDEIVGGTAAVYSVVEGTPNASPTVPSVPAITDTVIGQLLVHQAALSVTSCTWTKASVPEFANKPACIPLTQRNVANGVATLGSDSYINSLVPALATDTWLQNKIYSDEKVAIENIVGYDLDRYFTPYDVPIIVVIQGGIVTVTGPSVSITAGIVHYNGKNYPLQAGSVTATIDQAYLKFIAGTDTALDKTFNYSNGYFILEYSATPSFTVTSSHLLSSLKYLNYTESFPRESVSANRLTLVNQYYRLLKRGMLINLTSFMQFTASTGSDSNPPNFAINLFARYACDTRDDVRFPVAITDITANKNIGGYGIMQAGGRSMTIYCSEVIPVGNGIYVHFNFSYEGRYLH